MVELDLFVLTPVIAGFVGIAIGFFGIYSNIKTTKAKARAQLEKSIVDVKCDLKEYVRLKLDIMDTKVDSVKSEMRHSQELESRAKENREHFTKWNQRIEDKIDRLTPLPIKLSEGREITVAREETTTTTTSNKEEATATE